MDRGRDRRYSSPIQAGVLAPAKITLHVPELWDRADLERASGTTMNVLPLPMHIDLQTGLSDLRLELTAIEATDHPVVEVVHRLPTLLLIHTLLHLEVIGQEVVHHAVVRGVLQ